ncbi:hypothetical protein GL4_1223 [Methyloceanibacter caenitepidi]|uniref:Uncharacterized protein n=1 Tax=Methyloceanibacter caenitepidi TaxID=1384459 RepID=A0A0A8K1J3_9HYPH|nr:hypothetical protein GL4_1223 [Methyloceanibacter caenitepidi]
MSDAPPIGHKCNRGCALSLAGKVLPDTVKPEPSYESLRGFVEDVAECSEHRAARRVRSAGDLVHADRASKILKNVCARARDDAGVPSWIDAAYRCTWLASHMFDEGVKEPITEDSDIGLRRVQARMERVIVHFESGNCIVGQPVLKNPTAVQRIEVHNQTAILSQRLKAIE